MQTWFEFVCIFLLFSLVASPAALQLCLGFFKTRMGEDCLAVCGLGGLAWILLT